MKHRGWYKYINFYINLTNHTKSFNSGLVKYMRKAAHPSGCVDSLNPHHCRGKQLHHHGGGVCWLFVLLWIDLWCQELIVCKKLYKNNLKKRLTALLFDPPRHVPHPPGFQFTLAKCWALRPGGGEHGTCWYAYNMAGHACGCLLCGV